MSPVIVARTQAQLRLSTLYNLGAVFVFAATSSGSTTTTVGTSLLGGDNDHIGKFLIATSGSNNGEIVRVTDFVDSSDTLTHGAFTNATASGDTFELIDSAYPPTAIHDFFNQALIDATGHAFDPIENVSLHAGASSRFDIPTGISMLTRVQYRRSVDSREIIAAVAYDEAVDAEFKVTLDTEKIRAQSVAMVKKELLTSIAAYNLVVQFRRQAAKLAGLPPRRLSFTGVWNTFESFLLRQPPCIAAEWTARYAGALRIAARDKLPNRPGRSYPRRAHCRHPKSTKFMKQQAAKRKSKTDNPITEKPK